MEKNKIAFILLTHSSYFDICQCFLELFEKNFLSFTNKKVELIISYCGTKLEIKNYSNIYNGKEATLPDCLRNATESVDADLYFSFLGDAFFSRMVNIDKLERLIDLLLIDKINYCSLIPKRKYIYNKMISYNNLYRSISYNDLYAHSFIAFIASKEFIFNEFIDGFTDYDFEIKYLKMSGKKGFYNDRVILIDDVFNIIPGIQKGKWNRKCYKVLSKQSLQVSNNKRKKLSVNETIRNNIISCLQPVIPIKMRLIIKRILINSKLIKFSSKY